jgi:hypothetical protein
MIIRMVFSLAVLVLAGVLVVALFGHLWGRYQEQTAAIGTSEPLAAQAGFTGEPQTDGAAAGGEASSAVREAAAVEE